MLYLQHRPQMHTGRHAARQPQTVELGGCLQSGTRLACPTDGCTGVLISAAIISREDGMQRKQVRAGRLGTPPSVLWPGCSLSASGTKPFVEASKRLLMP